MLWHDRFEFFCHHSNYTLDTKVQEEVQKKEGIVITRKDYNTEAVMNEIKYEQISAHFLTISKMAIAVASCHNISSWNIINFLRNINEFLFF